MRAILIYCFTLLAFGSLTAQPNPNNAYINSRGCVVCDQYMPVDSFSFNNGLSYYTAANRGVLENSSQGKPLAILFGINDYSSIENLKNPLNDCREIGKTLRSLGWSTKVVSNPSYSDVTGHLRNFVKQASNNNASAVLIYFSGHGFQINDDNYLICSDFSLDAMNKSTYSGEGTIKLSQILNRLNTIGSKPKVVMLDACRSNPLGKDGLFLSEGLAISDAPSNTIIAYSTSPGKVAYDGKNDLGPYAEGLIESLTKFDNCFDVFLYTRLYVASMSDAQQIPWESNSLLEPFSFHYGSGLTAPEFATVNRYNSYDYNPVYFIKTNYNSGANNPTETVLKQLEEIIDNSSYEHFYQSEYNEWLDIESLKELYVSTVRNDMTENVAWKYRNLSRIFQNGIIHPSCRDNRGRIDHDCRDFDEMLIFYPDYELALFCAEEGYSLGGRCDVYASLYEHGHGVKRDYLRAYELYRESGRRGDEYYEVNINEMTQRLIEAAGYDITVDGSLGPQSKRYISKLAPSINQIGRILTKEQFGELITALRN